MSDLKKELGLIQVFSIAAGAMISSGLFILPGMAYFKAGPSVIVAYLIAGILVIPTMFSMSELATAMPKSGGTYFFVGRSLGAGFGTLAGISAWFALAFKSAFALLGIGSFGILIFPNLTQLQIKLIAVLFCLIFTSINIIGTKHSGKFQVILVVVLLILLIAFSLYGFTEVKNDNFEHFMKGNFRTLFMTAGLIFISYGGLTKISSIAEEVKNPNRNIPLGMILAFIVVTLLYVVVVFVTVGVLGKGLIENGQYSLTPISDAAKKLVGRPGIILMSLGAIFAFFSTGNAGILTASRSPLAMSRDKLLPSFFSRISERFKTPFISIIFTTAFMISVILFLDLEMLVKTASTIQIFLFLLVNIALVIMRESGIQNYRPKFLSPLYPYPQIFAVIAYIFLLIEMGIIPIFITAIFMLISFLWYLFYGKIRSNRESALVHLVKKITSKDLTSGTLESELKSIIRERDKIEKDRFDKLIEEAIVLDIEKAIDKEELFEIISKEVEKKYDEDFEYFYQKLIAREKESSTVLTDNLAIPHVIIDGEDKFFIILIRCKDGVYFNEKAKNIQTIFVIAGTSNERNFHLQALASIAQIMQNYNFEKKWLKAKSKENLRDIILLGERKRYT